MPAYFVTTETIQVKALIISDTSGADHYLAQTLGLQGITAETVEDLPSPSILSEYRYLFFFSRMNKKSLKKIQQLVTNQHYPQCRITVVLTETPRSKKKRETQQVLHRILGQALHNKLNIRVVYLHDLYGPKIIPSRQSLVGQILRKLGQSQIVIKAKETQTVFPLHIDDAVDGVLKATYSRDSLGKIYELAGHPISILNFAYKVRSLFPQICFGSPS